MFKFGVGWSNLPNNVYTIVLKPNVFIRHSIRRPQSMNYQTQRIFIVFLILITIKQFFCSIYFLIHCDTHYFCYHFMNILFFSTCDHAITQSSLSREHLTFISDALDDFISFDSANCLMLLFHAWASACFSSFLLIITTFFFLA